MSLLLNTNDKCKISLLSIIYLSSPLMADETLDSTGKREVEWGVRILDGNETDLSKNTTSAENSLYYVRANDKELDDRTKNGYCSHAKRIDSVVPINGSESGFNCTTGSVGLYFNLGLTFMQKIGGNNIETMRAYLKSEYDAGHPVIIFYPLATPTSETVSVPAIPTLKDNCTINVDTEVQPKNMNVTYLGMEGTKQHTTFKLGNGDILKTQDNRQFCVI